VYLIVRQRVLRAKWATGALRIGIFVVGVIRSLGYMRWDTDATGVPCPRSRLFDGIFGMDGTDSEKILAVLRVFGRNKEGERFLPPSNTGSVWMADLALL